MKIQDFYLFLKKHLRSLILIALLGIINTGFAQTFLKGKVTDENGEPIPGVNIIKKGTEQGVTFTRGYCTYPVCTASRKSFMTGMMPSKVTPTNYTSIASLLSTNGYETAYLGKWHVGSTEISGWSRDFLKQEHIKPFFLITSFLNPHDCCELARIIAGATDSYLDGSVEKKMDTAFCPRLPENEAIPENEAEGISARRNQDPGDDAIGLAQLFEAHAKVNYL